MGWKCPECGTYNVSDTVLRCSCGTELSQKEHHTLKKEWVPYDIQHPPSKMMSSFFRSILYMLFGIIGVLMFIGYSERQARLTDHDISEYRGLIIIFGIIIGAVMGLVIGHTHRYDEKLENKTEQQDDEK